VDEEECEQKRKEAEYNAMAEWLERVAEERARLRIERQAAQEADRLRIEQEQAAQEQSHVDLGEHEVDR
jgi:hypothetical protein